MVNSQLLPMQVIDNSVLSAIDHIPRHFFVPENLKKVAYIDDYLNFGSKRYLLPPSTFARLLQAAKIKPDDFVLDVGCLYGYSSAVIATLTKKVVAIESDENFASQAHNILHKHHIKNVIIVRNDLSLGHQETIPYQVIIINQPVSNISHTLINQLEDGGRLLAIIAKDGIGQAILLQKSGDSHSEYPLFEIILP